MIIYEEVSFCCTNCIHRDSVGNEAANICFEPNKQMINELMTLTIVFNPQL